MEHFLHIHASINSILISNILGLLAVLRYFDELLELSAFVDLVLVMFTHALMVQSFCGFNVDNPYQNCQSAKN